MKKEILVILVLVGVSGLVSLMEIFGKDQISQKEFFLIFVFGIFTGVLFTELYYKIKGRNN